MNTKSKRTVLINQIKTGTFRPLLDKHKNGILLNLCLFYFPCNSNVVIDADVLDLSTNAQLIMDFWSWTLWGFFCFVFLLCGH